MDAGMITEWREERRMKWEEMSEKQSLNTGEIDVLMKGGGDDGRKDDQNKGGIDMISNNNNNNTERIKLSAFRRKL